MPNTSTHTYRQLAHDISEELGLKPDSPERTCLLPSSSLKLLVALAERASGADNITTDGASEVADLDLEFAGDDARLLALRIVGLLETNRQLRRRVFMHGIAERLRFAGLIPHYSSSGQFAISLVVEPRASVPA